MLSAFIMCMALLFLTGSNLLIYPPGTSAKKDQTAQNSQNNPQGPVEEKPGSGFNNNILEEYVHETHPLRHAHMLIARVIYIHTGHEELQEMHSDLHTPPPKSPRCFC
jgi:hypothetical protein